MFKTKYRVVKFSNGKFGIQSKGFDSLWIWCLHQNEGVIYDFDTAERCEQIIAQWTKRYDVIEIYS